MRQFLTIAINAFMELVRQPVFLLLMTGSLAFEMFLAVPYYFAFGDEPKLVKKTLPIALTDELPTSRAIFLVPAVARDSRHPDIAWEFAAANMKTLLAKIDAAGANRYAPSLFTFFSDASRADELKSYAKANLPAASAPEVAKVVDEIQFRAEFKKRLAPQLKAWIDRKT